ncbi:2-hydroxychromene-2-carboxylate isomerase [Curvibacter sp. HBC61]|uniref:2-hydroxychromene-2-carboxylate isomerase n=1 Tax=Curvibacter cyanobacteriorum TaxID=3026422 RepID=A0ABT5N3W9_9BURK|nr:2-hydroxychromene-2-carboxylate isomerase [Curvibacter sp. HBC61]MDD0841002.1 2-hydroxychromene-2-carboxylate isomerase [Curvibacter sp. HBC61]
MKHIDFYLDFVSPYAWLALEQMPQALEGLSYHLHFKPVLLGALLKQHANPGPAGIEPKRDWTYRHVRWLGHSTGVGLQMPTQHPFAPLPLLRLALATSHDGRINRHVARELLRHVWQGGLDPLDPVRLQALRDGLRLQHEPESEQVKAWLRANTDEAQQRGVFGVPSWWVDGQVFWGLDALPMLRAYLQGDAWFDSAEGQAPEVRNGLKS